MVAVVKVNSSSGSFAPWGSSTRPLLLLALSTPSVMAEKRPDSPLSPSFFSSQARNFFFLSFSSRSLPSHSIFHSSVVSFFFRFSPTSATLSLFAFFRSQSFFYSLSRLSSLAFYPLYLTPIFLFQNPSQPSPASL